LKLLSEQLPSRTARDAIEEHCEFREQALGGLEIGPGREHRAHLLKHGNSDGVDHGWRFGLKRRLR
jgi:hypothetical protein